MIGGRVGVMDTTVVLELVEESVFKLSSLVMVCLGWETKTHDKVIKKLSGCGLPRLISCCICVCIFGKMIIVFLSSLKLVQM